MAILLKRNAKVFISLVDSGWTVDNTIRLNVLDDFSYSQVTGTDSATRSTLGPTGDRGLSSFVQETNPAQFSFTTYLSLFSGTLSDNILWKALTNKTSVDAIIDFTESNVATLPEIFVYFEHGSKTYKISNSVVTGASISMEISSVPKITWSGTGKALSTSSIPTLFTDEHGAIPESLGKLTTLDLTRDGISYTLALTDFKLSIDNGVFWVSRNRLGKQTLPEVYQTGARAIEGSMQFYLKTGSNVSTDLLDNILGDNLTGAAEKFSDMTINLGEDIALHMPNTLLQSTDIGVEDALTLTIPFIANQTAANAADELNIELNALKAIANPIQASLDPNTNSTTTGMSAGDYQAWILNPLAIANFAATGGMNLQLGTNVNMEIYEENAGVYKRVSSQKRVSPLFDLTGNTTPAATNVAFVVRANQATTVRIRANL